MNKLELGPFVLLVSLAANAQTATLTTASNDGRPVNTLLSQIEKLSGIPVNYEDLLYGNPNDTMDVANAVANGNAAPGVHLIVPRGGALSVSLSVDSATQKLVDYLATANALNALLASASGSPIVAGSFRLDSYNKAFFVVPTQSRSDNNEMVPVTPVLSTPIDLQGVKQTAFETLRAIVSQVSQKTAVKIEIGTGASPSLPAHR